MSQVTFTTPEDVEITYEPAGPGTRYLAVFIDQFIIGVFKKPGTFGRCWCLHLPRPIVLVAAVLRHEVPIQVAFTAAAAANNTTNNTQVHFGSPTLSCWRRWEEIQSTSIVFRLLYTNRRGEQ